MKYIVLTTGVRLDLSSHTVVAEAFVVPRYDGFLSPLDDLDVRRCPIKFTAEQLTVWEYLLPFTAERCRDWAHKDDCLYKQTRTTLSTLPPGKSPICECGNGHVTDAFRQQPGWASWAKHATRIVLSPLFSVSYLDPTLSIERILSEDIIRIFEESHGVSAAMWGTLRFKGGRIGKDYSQTLCSGCTCWIPRVKRKTCSKCKQVIYCSEICQKNHWQEHKPICMENRERQRSQPAT